MFLRRIIYPPSGLKLERFVGRYQCFWHIIYPPLGLKWGDLWVDTSASETPNLSICRTEEGDSICSSEMLGCTYKSTVSKPTTTTSVLESLCKIYTHAAESAHRVKLLASHKILQWPKETYLVGAHLGWVNTEALLNLFSQEIWYKTQVLRWPMSVTLTAMHATTFVTSSKMDFWHQTCRNHLNSLDGDKYYLQQCNQPLMNFKHSHLQMRNIRAQWCCCKPTCHLK